MILLGLNKNLQPHDILWNSLDTSGLVAREHMSIRVPSVEYKCVYCACVCVSGDQHGQLSTYCPCMKKAADIISLHITQ